MTDPHLNRRGSGEPLLLIHGLHHSAQAWDLMVDDLAEDFDVLAVNLPGHGGAPNLHEDPTTEALSDHLETVLDREGVGDVHVAGNSLGGLLAIRLGQRGRARSVTAFSPAGMVRPGLESRLVHVITMGLILRVAPLLKDVGPVTDTAVGRTVALSAIMGKPQDVDPAYARAAMHAVSQATDPHRTKQGVTEWQDTVKPIEAPTTIAWGDRDRLLLPRQGARWKAALPDADLVRLRGLGHVPMAEDPALCSDLIRRTAARAAAAA